MAEVAHESTKMWSTKRRIAVFLAAMRHFRDALRARDWRVCYRELSADSAVWRGADGRAKPAKGDTFADALRESLATIKPQRVVMDISSPEFVAILENDATDAIRREIESEFRSQRVRESATLDLPEFTQSRRRRISVTSKLFGSVSVMHWLCSRKAAADRSRTLTVAPSRGGRVEKDSLGD